MRALTIDEISHVSGGLVRTPVYDHRGKTAEECAAFAKMIDDGGNIYTFTKTETPIAGGGVSITVTCTVTGAGQGKNDWCPDGMDGPACIRKGEGFFSWSGRVGGNPIEAGGAILQGYIDGLVEAFKSVEWEQEFKNQFEDHLRGGPVRPWGTRRNQ